MSDYTVISLLNKRKIARVRQRDAAMEKYH
jgi:hypothetical protein